MPHNTRPTYYPPGYIMEEKLSWENHQHRPKALYYLDEIIPDSGGHRYARCRCGAWRLEPALPDDDFDTAMAWLPGAGPNTVIGEECDTATQGLGCNAQGLRAAIALGIHHAGLSPDCPQEKHGEAAQTIADICERTLQQDAQEVYPGTLQFAYKFCRFAAQGTILRPPDHDR